MSRSIHFEAEQDLVDAADFYERSAGPDLAARFFLEFERVEQLLAENPGFGTPISGGRRIFPLKGFPYSIVYRVQVSGIRVLAVRHQSRKNSFASKRH